MRYIIIGAGAVGGTIGARLQQAGYEVVFAARGRHQEELRDRGLTFATPDGTVTLPVHVVSDPGGLTLRGDDVLILTVKTQDAGEALASWAWQPVGAGVAADALPVFCALNGVASERIALRRFRHVYGVCVWLPATHLEPGVIEAQGAPMSGLLPVGRYPAGTDETVLQVSADLGASRFLAPASADVMRWKYTKLLSNLANSVEAMFGATESGEQDAPGARLAARAREEATAVLAAAGIEYASQAEFAELRSDQVRMASVNGSRRGGGSSWQSLSRGAGSIEADYLNGEIVLLGRQHGVPAPVNELLRQKANEFARQRRAPGSITADEIAALLTA
ncbi:MAG TPA: 2-dehydropantoate 2-reductase N-terminal domain-containing protein [Streptosporangiaceae bacterium]